MIMTTTAIQKEIFNSLLGINPVRYSELENENIAITTNGYMAYVLPKKLIFFDLDKCIKVDVLADIAHKMDSDVQLKVTEDLKNGYNYLAARLTDGKMDIFVNQRYLKPFEHCTFWGYDPTQRILAVTRSGEIAGLILPIDMRR